MGQPVDIHLTLKPLIRCAILVYIFHGREIGWKNLPIFARGIYLSIILRWLSRSAVLNSETRHATAMDKSAYCRGITLTYS